MCVCVCVCVCVFVLAVLLLSTVFTGICLFLLFWSLFYYYYFIIIIINFFYNSLCPCYFFNPYPLCYYVISIRKFFLVSPRPVTYLLVMLFLFMSNYCLGHCSFSPWYSRIVAQETEIVQKVFLLIFC